MAKTTNKQWCISQRQNRKAKTKNKTNCLNAKAWTFEAMSIGPESKTKAYKA